MQEPQDHLSAGRSEGFAVVAVFIADDNRTGIRGDTGGVAEKKRAMCIYEQGE